MSSGLTEWFHGTNGATGVRQLTCGVASVLLHAWPPNTVLAAPLPVAPPAPMVAPDGGAPRAHVEIRVVGPEQVKSELRQRLGRSIEERATLTWATVPEFARQHILDLVPLSQVLIHCWIDLSDHELARLYFVAPAHDRFMVRELELGASLGEVELESLAQVIEMSLQVLLTNNDAGLSRSEARELLLKEQGERASARSVEPTEKRDERRAEHPSSVRLRAAVHYRAVSLASDVLLHGPGGSFVLEHTRELSLDEWSATIAYAWPTRVEHPMAVVSLDRLELGASGARLWSLGRQTPWRIGPRFGTFVGATRATPEPGDSEGTYDLTRRSLRFELAVVPEVVLRLDLSRHCAAKVGLSLVIVPKPVRYELTVDGRPERIIQERHVRPGLEFALSFP